MNSRTARLTKQFLRLTAIFYGIYAFNTLIESIDFLDLLHTEHPGYSATYDMVNVAYYMVEAIICISLAFGHWFMLEHLKKSESLLYLLVFFLLFRLGVVYYLYLYTEDEYRWVPFIYKKANFLSELRILIIPLQIIFGMLSVFWWIKFLGKSKEQNTD